MNLSSSFPLKYPYSREFGVVVATNPAYLPSAVCSLGAYCVIRYERTPRKARV